MSAMMIIVQGVLAAGVLAAVAYPLFREDDAGALVPTTSDDLRAQREDLLAARKVAYESIKEIELEWVSGKLSEADYQSMRRELEQEAIQVLQKLDALEQREAAASEEPGVRRLSCPSCGRPAKLDHAFCPDCGAKVS